MAEHEKRMQAKWLRQQSDVSSATPSNSNVLAWNQAQKKWAPAAHDLSSHTSLGLASASHGHSEYATTGHTHPPAASHSHTDFAGPTIRLYGITSPSPMSPGQDIEYGWHFENAQHHNNSYFSWSPGSNVITVLKDGIYLISASFVWNENEPQAWMYSTEEDYQMHAVRFALGDRSIHVSAAGQTVIDAHHSPNFNRTTNEGTTQVYLFGNQSISASYWFFPGPLGGAAYSDFYPVVGESGVHWPSISATYLGQGV